MRSLHLIQRYGSTLEGVFYVHNWLTDSEYSEMID
jgi:hypothetical protein